MQYIDSLSDAQVVDELQKHHATAGKATNELSIKDARQFLTHVLRSTTTLAVTGTSPPMLVLPRRLVLLLHRCQLIHSRAPNVSLFTHTPEGYSFVTAW